ncbi:MAG: hypothetical protein IJZ89_07470 [Clostridia bacterium]|nr:hypothetical protein [Clostridia bacterium]
MVIKNTAIKRWIAAFLASLVLLTLSACSASEMSEGDADDTEFSFSSLEVMPSADSSIQTGNNIPLPSEFTVLCEKGTEGDFFASMEDTDIFSKTVFERNAQLYEQYGVLLKEETEADIVNRVKNDMLSEDKGYDMLLLFAPSSASLITAGALADLESIAGFDGAAKGYSEQIIRDLSIGGRTFLAAGDATPSLIRSASAVLINNELAKMVTEGNSIYSVVKNGRFTYEAMLNLSGALTELNGAEDAVDPSSAIRAGAEDALNLFLAGGGKFFTVDAVTDVPSAADFEGDNSEIYSSVMSLFGISADDSEENDINTAAVTPLFTVSSIGELEALAAENAPFSALPMPKMSVIQENYYCNIDISRAVFTALPLGSGEIGISVMNLIYSISESITDSILGACDHENSGTARMVYESMSAEVLTLFGFGDLQSLMVSCVNERTAAKVFAMRAAERSTAAAAALSIIAEKFSAGNH